MTAAMTCSLVLLSVLGGSFRMGFSFDAGFPAMSDEKEYAELLGEAGIDYSLSDVAWTGGVEALGDVSDDVRLRGSVTVTRFTGAYEEDYNPLSYILLGIFTGGIGFIFGSPDADVITLEDQAMNVELSAYYKLVDGPVTLSAGGGPSMSFVSRKLDTPNTSQSDEGTSLGFTAGLRLDMEPGAPLFGCLPLVFGTEGGYRFSKTELDGISSQGFEVDFSGPYLKVGSYFAF
jgi:hypothetical protein